MSEKQLPENVKDLLSELREIRRFNRENERFAATRFDIILITASLGSLLYVVNNFEKGNWILPISGLLYLTVIALNLRHLSIQTLGYRTVFGLISDMIGEVMKHGEQTSKYYEIEQEYSSLSWYYFWADDRFLIALYSISTLLILINEFL